ncbi:MAG: hypothetical protein HYX79_02860 [Chloroflexi bacterium]|nr:hypothetical protein [Chloroflexota bacterium]
MADELKIIREVIEAHHRLRERVGQVGQSVSDYGALFSLQSAQAGIATGGLEGLPERLSKMQEMMASLEKGIVGHFAWEEKVLPPLFGDLLMRALKFEHKVNLAEIARARSTIAAAGEKNLAQAELLSRKARLLEAVGNVCQYFEEHATREEIILNMMKRALEAEAEK